MSSLMQVLHEIQTIRTDLADVRQQLDRGPLQLKGSLAQVNKKGAAVDALKAELKELRKSADSKELTLKTAEARVRDLRGKLNMTTNTKEFEAIKDEIARIENANTAIETEVFEIFSQQEAKAAEIATAEAEHAAATAEHAKLKEVIDYKMQKLTDRVGLLEGKLKELEGQLSPTPLQDYRRMTKGKGDGGLANCVDGVCQACYSPQPPQAWQELLAGRSIFCTSCGAMLYRHG